MLRAIVSVCLFAVLALTSIPANAQTSDNRTYFTFSQPVTLPGITLPPGMYVFRIVDNDTSADLSRVSSKDEGSHVSEPARAPSILDLPPAVLPPPVLDGTFPLAPWLGALSMVAGAWSQKGPHLGV